jgi:hypothetical protein
MSEATPTRNNRSLQNNVPSLFLISSSRRDGSTKLIMHASHVSALVWSEWLGNL